MRQPDNDENTRSHADRAPSLGFRRELRHRVIHLRASCKDLAALARAGEDILRADELTRPKLSKYTIRASIIVMACATIEGILVDLCAATAKAERLEFNREDRKGRSLDRVKAFFKEVAHLRFPDQTDNWGNLEALFLMRNGIAHRWGHLREKDWTRVRSLMGVTIDADGEVNLDAEAVGGALRTIRKLAAELEEYLDGDQVESTSQ